ncbi:MAG: hypothetical protein ACYC66_00080 [Chloroflexota bacterium]
MRFGGCLAQLVDKYGWKRPELVKALGERGIHPTQVRRWLRNERTPKLDSGYPETIAELLGLSEGDRERLLDAQVESLRGEAGVATGRERAGAHRLLQDAGHHSERADATMSRYGPSRETASGVIRGRQNLLKAATALVAAAPEPPPDGHQLLLTNQSQASFGDSSGHSPSWSSVLRTALRKGCDVVHLVRLGSDTRRPALVVEHLLRLQKMEGQYRPYYFSEYGGHPNPWEVFVVPDVGAIVALATDRPDAIDTGLLLTNPQQVEAVRAHLALLRTQTKALLEVHVGGGINLEYAEAVVQAQELEGNDFSLVPGLTSYTQPYSWLRENTDWARAVAARQIDPGTMIGLQRRRLDAFYRQVEQYSFWQICSKSALLHFVREGQGVPSDPYCQVTLEDRLEQLENVVALLNTFDNYKLALASEAEKRSYLLTNHWQVKWAVKGDHRVLMETQSPGESGGQKRLGLEIVEHAVCRAFRDHFLDLFENRISPVSRDKREVKLFLEAQIDWLRQRTGAAR